MDNQQQFQGNNQYNNQQSQMNGQVYYQMPMQAPVRKLSVNGLGIAGMIVGIVGILLSCIGIGAILGVIGLILSLCAYIPKNTKYGMATAGVILSAFAIFIWLIILFFGIRIGDNDVKVSHMDKEQITESIPKDDAVLDYEESYTAGSIIETNDSIITFISCGDYEVDNEYLLPKEGFKYVTAEFEIENIGSTDMMVSYYDFDCYADGYSVDHAYVSDDNELSATISAGRKAKGTVNFEVPEDAEEIVLEYSPNLFSSKKIKFIVE